MKRDRLVLDIYINDILLPLEQMPVLKLLITASVSQNVPTAELVLADPHNVFKRWVTLSDGCKVVIDVGTGDQVRKQYPMRVFKFQHINEQAGASYRIVMYHDNPVYWQGTTNLQFDGTAADAIAYIASTNGLEAVVEPTADSMTWLPMNERWCRWAHKIARAAYLDETSGYLLGLRLDQVLAFQNVAAYKYDESLPRFVNVGASDSSVVIPVTSHKVSTISGFNNMSGGYHAVAQAQTAVADAAQKFEQVTKVKATQDLSMNAEVKDLLAEARRVMTTLIDSGNTHANYQRACYQNKRLAMTNSNNLTVLTPVVSNLDLLDRCRAQIFDPPLDGAPRLNTDASGYYFVTAKSLYVGPELMYCEKYVLSTSGHNADPQKLRGDSDGG